MAAEAYLYQSIVDPTGHQLEGWGLHMPTNYREVLTDQQIADLIAYFLDQ